MSIYAVNHACRELLRDPAFREAMREDPWAALNPLDLSDDERRAMAEGDVAWLYRAGAHDFLLGYLMRFGIGGLTLPIYNQRMRSLAPHQNIP
jgi:hypothetical protein